MTVSIVTAPGETQVVDAPKPSVGPADVLVKIRACGICGTDALFISLGGMPGHEVGMPLGHEPAGEVVEVGAGPIGLGATIAFKSLGVSHVVVADLIPARLDKALKVGADAVINSADEDVTQRLIELHGVGESLFPGKVDTDIYFDAAGASAVINTALAGAKPGARLGVVAVHKQPVPVDFQPVPVDFVNLMTNEITIVGSMGYPDAIFEVTKDPIANWEKYAVIVSHTIPFDAVNEALKTASTPGDADKVVVTFN